MTRRHLLRWAGGMMAATLPAGRQTGRLVAMYQGRPNASPDITGRLARYMAAARDRELPAAVVVGAKHRILDTLSAMVSGAKLKPGEMAIQFARAQSGAPEASVVTANLQTSAINAALANGMCAHADETDDFDPVTKAHPGCSAVPAALAMAERDGRSGTEFLRAVVLGYDVSCRLLLALDPDLVRASHRSAEGTGATFGATAAAASLARLDERAMRYAISYAAQQTSGLWSWVGDTEHVEKAFDFAGMGARNGVTAAVMAEMGFSGVPDVLDGEHNLLQALSTNPHREAMVSELGERFLVTETSIKVFSVGAPIQSAIDALLTLRREHRLTPDNVSRIRVRLPEDGARIVDNSAMPDVNCQYIIAVTLIDGTVSFDASHSQTRMADPQVRSVKSRVELIADRSLMVPEAPRSALVEATLTTGATVSHFTRHPPGTKENPLTTEAVNEKARRLMIPVIGAQRTDALIARVNALESVGNMRELRGLI